MEKLRETISVYDTWEGLGTYVNRIETFLDTDFINKWVSITLYGVKYQEYLGESDGDI